MEPLSVVLDPTLRSSDAADFEAELNRRVVGQAEPVAKTSEVIQTFMAGFAAGDRPAGSLLFLGPTGVGKTRLVEVVADVLFGNPKAFFKINCAEYQDSYQSNRLLGAPPGYIGYSEGKGDSMISQEKLDQYQKEDLKLNLVLFDEVEKAHDNLFQLMLNILDKGEMTTSNGKKVDFTRSIVFMTSNLGASKMGKSIGFCEDEAARLDVDNRRVIEEAVNKKFQPEFLNRIDHQVVFQTLKGTDLKKIVELELNAVRRRIMQASIHLKFQLAVSDAACAELIRRGFSAKYGARELKRVIERDIVNAVANMALSGQIDFGSLVEVDFADHKFSYRKFDGDQIATLSDERFADFKAAIA